ncbi:ankyrin repeat domain-containing protein [Acinetobacter sp. CUI P1]|nr:ankyrin repeat domain-containing protein [Acinetobacter sp. CUI P1]
MAGCTSVDSTESTLLTPTDPYTEKFQADLEQYCGLCIVNDIYHHSDDEILIAFAPKSWGVKTKKDLDSVGYYLYEYIPSQNSYYAVTYNILISHPDMPHVESDLGSEKYNELLDAYNSQLRNYQFNSDSSVDEIDDNGDSKLMFAVKYGKSDMVKDLLANGADVNWTNNVGNTALNKAVQQNTPESISILKYLIEKGADVNIGSSLEIASTLNNTETIRILLEAGADPLALDSSGVTIVEGAVISAIENNEPDNKTVQMFYAWLQQHPDQFKKSEYDRILETLKKYNTPATFSKWYREFEKYNNQIIPETCIVGVDCLELDWWWIEPGIAPDPEK